MPRWYVVQTKVKKESVAQEYLERQGHPTYCPHITHLCRRHGTWQKVSEPLFSRYLFVRLTEGESNFSPVSPAFGISKLLCLGDKVAILSNEVIEAKHRQEEQLARSEQNNMPWKEGEIMHIVEGPFTGLSAISRKKATKSAYSSCLTAGESKLNLRQCQQPPIA